MVKSQGRGDLTKHFFFALWRWYLWNAIKESFHIWNKHALGLKDELQLHFGGQRSKGQGLCDLVKHMFALQMRNLNTLREFFQIWHKHSL